MDEPTDSQLPGGEEVFGDLLNIQATVDVLKNPLFSALVEIRNKYEEVWIGMVIVMFVIDSPLKFSTRYGWVW